MSVQLEEAIGIHGSIHELNKIKVMKSLSECSYIYKTYS